MSDSTFPVQATTGTGSRRADLDNLIRRELRVGDPNDPKQVAQALMQRYADSPAARSLVNEAKGLPFLQAAIAAPAPVATSTATGVDLQQAKDDVEADLRELLTTNLLKDVKPELEGWADAIRGAVAEGERCAGQGMDTAQRDKTFAIRRQLGDYARVARLVGCYKPAIRDDFRSLAQSLDEAGAVLLVMMGESIAASGIAGGRYLLQVPFSELQARREAVLYALRNLLGSSQYAYQANDLPRGLSAYRELVRSLEEQGQGELRSLLNEAEMSRVMDQLIDRAGQGVNGLRALASTVGIDIQRFRRLQSAIRWNIDDSVSAPALLALQEALGLFIDGFTSSGGIRLLHVARPQVLWYGLYRNLPYGKLGQRTPEDLLGRLLRDRGNLAAFADEYADNAFAPKETRSLVMMDQALYSLDRAIDLYAVGAEGLPPEPEIRAGGYGWLLYANAKSMQQIADDLAKPVVELLARDGERLAGAHARSPLMMQEIAIMWQHELESLRTVQQFVGEPPELDWSYGRATERIDAVPDDAGDIPLLVRLAYDSSRNGATLPPVEVELPDLMEVSLERIADVADAGQEEGGRRHERYDELRLLLNASRALLAAHRGKMPVRLPITPQGSAYRPKGAEDLWDYGSRDDAEAAIEVLALRLQEMEARRAMVRGGSQP